MVSQWSLASGWTRKRLAVSGLALAIAMGGFSPAHATLIDYTLNPDVPGLIISGNTYDVTATFSWDTSTDLESNVDIVLTGTGSYAGTYTSTPDIISATHSQVTDNKDICGEFSGNLAVCLRFDSVLGTVPDTLFGVFAGNQAPDLNAPSTGSVSGHGQQAVLTSSLTTAVPEPASFGLLTAGLVGAVVARRRRTRTAVRAEG